MTTEEPAAAEENTRPRTRLQSGIRKAKTYTDCTIRYGCFTSSGEPQYLEEALNNKDWKVIEDRFEKKWSNRKGK